MSPLRLVFLLCVVFAAGCATGPARETIAHEVYSYPEEPTTATPGAIYRTGSGTALFEDVRPRRVGDMITVLLAERTDAAQSSSTSTSKDNAIGISNPTLFGAPFGFGIGGLGDQRRNLENDLSSSRSFSGEGGSEQRNELSGSITATVIEVLPNGYLRVRGEKRIAINKGREYIRVTGVVRPVDIQADNTVLSTQIANAEIDYGGSGLLADASEPGWLSRFFNSAWWPF